MHHSLRDALVIEVSDLFPKMKILQQRRPASASPQPVLVIGDLKALVACYRLARLDGVYGEIGQSAGLLMKGPGVHGVG